MADLRVDSPWLLPPRSNHAELPLWDEASQTLYWVDMEPEPSVHRVTSGLDGQTHVRAVFPGQGLAGGVFVRRDRPDELIVGTRYGWGSARIDADKAEVVDFAPLVDVRNLTDAKSSSSWDAIRLNEATSDAKGRIWFATCAEGESDVKPTLYLFDPSTTQVVVVPCAPAELTMPNAMVISQGRFYMACSERGKIWSWRLDLDATDPPAMLNDGRLFLEIDKPAVPDGMTADADGNLWLACFNAGSVRVFSPQGMLLRTIHLPAELPTCTVFAGPALDDLIVTTHAVQDELRQQVVDAGQDSLRSVDDVKRRWPEDKGGIYRVKVPGVRGLAKPRVG